MKRYKVLSSTVSVVLLALLGVFSPVWASGQAAQAEKKVEKPLVQLAILLDTSGSMDGLIEQAKTQLWKIVNELATGKQNGIAPDLEVALYEYGKDSLPASEGYLRMISPLSGDLDKISEELFKLRTNGGSEYCGQVIRESTRDLKWSHKADDLKIIFIAGNEEFTQGGVDYKVSCKDAIAKGIIVNTIFCGPYKEGVDTFWKSGAELADGKYMNIDQNQQLAHIDAPQDKQIIALGQKLNSTYIAYGAKGGESKKRQEVQDSNAASASPASMVQRSVTKSKANYSNVQWDMVDGVAAGSVDVDKMDEQSLPEEMRKMSKEERKKYVAQKAEERKKIQAEIDKLNKERDAYVAKQRTTKAGQATLDEAIVNVMRQQAKKKNFVFEEVKK